MAYHSNGGYSGDERESRSGGDDRPDSDLSDKPVYLLEHLATFTVNKDTGIVYPADGMKRLLQLEKTTGIWSQKMQLCLDNQWVLIMDYETGNVIERFPATQIQEPTAFTSSDLLEIYNNILVFIVAGNSGSRSEMHIFQSQSISAVHLVEDLKQLRNGKILTQHRETNHPPMMHPKMSTSSGQVGGGQMQTTATSTIQQQHHHQQQQQIHQQHQHHQQLREQYAAGQETDSELGAINDETSSTSSDKYERDVAVLNHCFDDIEKFIARLQHAAAASRELEKRRRNRKSKKKDPGEGLLTLRTRPPLEKEFIDIFAKFKLSFNLLAKLKAHIHDPNAPELVHFLFTPLALIVEAASDTYYESHLPARVINPLLTREAVNLLINCVTSKETELWRSLGDAWIIPRDQWKGHIGSYHPVFFDGWSPDYPVVDELEHSTTPTNISGGNSGGGGGKRRIETHHNFGSNNVGAQLATQTVPPGGDYDIDGMTSVSEKYHQHHHHHGARSDISIDSIERNGGGGANGAPNGNSPAAMMSLVGSMQNHHISQPLTGPGQNHHNNSSNNNSGELNIEAWLDDLQSRGAKIVQVTYPRTANNDKELSVVRGEYLEILDDTRKWWKARNSRGQMAHVPHTIVTPFNENGGGASSGGRLADNGASSGTVNDYNNQFYGGGQQSYSKSMNSNRHVDNETMNGPSPPSQSSTPNTSAEWVRNKHIGKKGEFRYF